MKFKSCENSIQDYIQNCCHIVLLFIPTHFPNLLCDEHSQMINYFNSTQQGKPCEESHGPSDSREFCLKVCFHRVGYCFHRSRVKVDIDVGQCGIRKKNVI